MDMTLRILVLSVTAVLLPALSACAQPVPSGRPAYFEPASSQARQMIQNPPADASRPSSDEERTLLAAHNAERLRAGAVPLTWSETLEAEARDWAVTLMESDRFAHDPRPHGHGENLWMGWGDRVFQPEDMVGGWIAERRLYRAGVFPNVSRTGDWVAVGHYTQLIWRGTTDVGCAVAAGAIGRSWRAAIRRLAMLTVSGPSRLRHRPPGCRSRPNANRPFGDHWCRGMGVVQPGVN